MSKDIHQLMIKSTDRLSSSTSSANAKFFLTNPVTLQDRKYVQLEYLLAYSSVPNIQTGVNDSIPYNDNGTIRNVTIPQGFYNASSFAAAIQTAMSALTSGLTCTYSSTTRALTIANATSVTLLWASGANSKTSCYREAGWTNASGGPVDSAASTSVSSLFAVQLNFPLAALVAIPELGFLGKDSAGQPFTFSVGDSALSGNALVYDSGNSYKQTLPIGEKSNGSTLVSLSVRFIDPRTQADLNLMNSDWIMILNFL